MRVSTADVSTEKAGSYLRNLCQHWSHRFSVTVEGDRDSESGTIDLPQARCRLRAAAKALNVRLEFIELADEARVRDVVEDHLRRFGFREELVFPWISVTE